MCEQKRRRFIHNENTPILTNDKGFTMEGDLSKKSIHINESFVHAIYIGIVVNSYSDIVAYI